MADGNWFDVIYKLNSIFSTRFAAVCARGYHFMYGVSYIYNIYIYVYIHTQFWPSTSNCQRESETFISHYTIPQSCSLIHASFLFFFSFFFHAWTSCTADYAASSVPALVTMCTIFVFTEALRSLWQSALQFQSLSWFSDIMDNGSSLRGFVLILKLYTSVFGAIEHQWFIRLRPGFDLPVWVT